MIKIPCTGINEAILILKSVTHNIHVCKKYVKIGSAVLSVKIISSRHHFVDNVNSNINDTLYIETYSWLTLLNLLRFQSLVIQLNIID